MTVLPSGRASIVGFRPGSGRKNRTPPAEMEAKAEALAKAFVEAEARAARVRPRPGATVLRVFPSSYRFLPAQPYSDHIFWLLCQQYQ